LDQQSKVQGIEDSSSKLTQQMKAESLKKMKQESLDKARLLLEQEAISLL